MQHVATSGLRDSRDRGAVGAGGVAAFVGQPDRAPTGIEERRVRDADQLPSLKRVYRLNPLLADQNDNDPGPRLGVFARPVGDPAPFSSNPDRVVYLAYTSGTTGRPKGVMHSDNTILANSRAMVKDWQFGADTIVDPSAL